MSDVSKIAKEFYKEAEKQPKAAVFALCEQLWRLGVLEDAVIACEWSYARREQFVPDDFKIFERWLTEYVDNRAPCDTLCNHTAGCSKQPASRVFDFVINHKTTMPRTALRSALEKMPAEMKAEAMKK